MFLPYLSFLKLRNRELDFFFRNLSFVGISSAFISPQENLPDNFCPIFINISQIVWFWVVFIFDLFKCSAITFNLITVCLCSSYLIVWHWTTLPHHLLIGLIKGELFLSNFPSVSKTNLARQNWTILRNHTYTLSTALAKLKYTHMMG